MAFTTQPNGGPNDQDWTTQPVVKIQDSGGNTITTSTDTITLAITSQPGNGASLTCNGARTKAATAGVATFTNCKIVGTAGNYTITATDTTRALNPATSTTFSITVGTAAQLAFTTQPNGGPNGQTWTTQPSTIQQRRQHHHHLHRHHQPGHHVPARNRRQPHLQRRRTQSGRHRRNRLLRQLPDRWDRGHLHHHRHRHHRSQPHPRPRILLHHRRYRRPAGLHHPTRRRPQRADLDHPASRDHRGQRRQHRHHLHRHHHPGHRPTTRQRRQPHLQRGSHQGRYRRGGDVHRLQDRRDGRHLHHHRHRHHQRTQPRHQHHVLHHRRDAAQLAFTTQPSGGPNGATWATQPVVTVQDSGGNTITTSTDTITLAITSQPGTGATLTCNGGPPNLAATGGIATFAGCQIVGTAGTYTITATDTTVPSLNPTTSDPFPIS